MSLILNFKPILRPCISRSLTTKVQSLAEAFNDSSAATFLAAAATTESVPKLHGLPEVIVAGRANAGKSTLMNAVLGRKELVRTSKKAGRTRALNFFRVGSPPGRLVLVDSPGYGMRGKAEWGELWDHYIDTRRELRQICILINSKHGVTDFDLEMLQDLQTRLSTRADVRPSLQPILTKIDTLEGDSDTLATAIRTITKDIVKYAKLAERPILCAVSKTQWIGVDAVRKAMAESCGR